MNIFSQASALVAQTLDAYAAENAVYARGGESAPCLVTPGKMENDVELRNGIGHDKQLQVFIVTAANLPAFIAGQPEADDVITVNGVAYTVIPYAGTKVAHASDPAGVRIRIYTVKN